MSVWMLSFDNRTVKNREFWVSTGVDFAVSVGVGVAAAALVGIVTIAVAASVGVTAPLWLTFAATAGLGIWLGGRVERLGWPEKANNAINGWLNGIVGGGK